MTNSAPLFSYHKNLAKYRNDQRESKEFKADLARLNEALEGGYDAAGPHAFEKKENLARGEFIEDQVLLWFIALVPYDSKKKTHFWMTNFAHEYDKNL